MSCLTKNTKDQLWNVCRQMRPKSQAKEFSGTVKEVLGTCNAVGCTVDGQNPIDLTAGVDDGSFVVPKE